MLDVHLLECLFYFLSVWILLFMYMKTNHIAMCRLGVGVVPLLGCCALEYAWYVLGAHVGCY